MYYMVTCSLLFAHQYQMGSGARVLNLYTIPLGFNGNKKTSKGDFEKMGSSSSHFHLHHFSLTLHDKPFFSMLVTILRLSHLPSPTRFPFCISLLSRNGTKMVAFVWSMEIFQRRRPTPWISHGGKYRFRRHSEVWKDSHTILNDLRMIFFQNRFWPFPFTFTA